MDENLTLTSLEEKIRQRKQEQIQKIMEAEKESLKELLKSLREYLAQEQSITKSDINQKSQELKEEIQSSIEKIEKLITSYTTKLAIDTVQEIKEAKKKLKQEIEEIENITTNLSHWKKVTLIPIIAPFIFTFLLFMASWGTIKYYTHEITTMREEISQMEKIKEQMNPIERKYIKQVWDNAIGVEKKPMVWESKDGLWIVQFEKSKEN